MTIGHRIGVICETTGFAGIIVLILWLPLPWASNRVWSALVFQIFAALIFLFCSTRFFAKSNTVPVQHSQSRMLMVLLLIWCCFLFLQIAPLPAELIAWMAPTTYVLYTELIDHGIGQVVSRLSVAADVTYNELLRYIGYILLFVSTLLACHSYSRAKRLLYIVLLSGMLQVVIGIVTQVSGFSIIPDDLRDGHWQRMTGTFVNGNHFAVYIGFSYCIAFSFFLREFWRYGEFKILNLLETKTLMFAVLMIVFVYGIIQSGSRGGLLAVLVVSFLCMGVTLVRQSNISVSYVFALVLGVLSVSLMLLFFVTDSMLESRFFAGDFSIGERWPQWQLSSSLINERPIIGSGAGTYHLVFPSVRDGSLQDLTYNSAHSDLVRILVEQGVVGVGFGVGVLLLFFVSIWKILRYNFTSRAAGLSLATGAAVSMVALTAFYEINFHITANAATFFIIMAVGMSAPAFVTRGKKIKRVRNAQ